MKADNRCADDAKKPIFETENIFIKTIVGKEHFF